MAKSLERFSLVAGLLVASVSLAAAQAWDLAKDFSLNSNPNGAWSYGSSQSLGAFNVYVNNANVGQHYLSVFGINGIDGWSRSNDAFPMVARNDSGGTIFQTWAPGQVILHPQNGGLLSIARWIDPNPGQALFRLDSSFRRVEDVTSFVSDYWVLVNGSIMSSGTLLTLNQSAIYNSLLSLHQGDTVDFVVGSEVDSAGTDLNVGAVLNSVFVDNPSAYSIVKGQYVSGSLSSLFNADGSYLVARTNAARQRTSIGLTITLDATSSVATPTDVRFILTGHVNSTNLGQKIEMYDYQASAWVAVSSVAATQTDSTVTVIASSPARFVQTGTNAMRARLSWNPTGITSMFPWSAYVDQAVWNVSP